ncbi:efflux RND transporter periplasmic adaptor subunit [Thiobacillus sp.]|uniref:efflux RND transporter periplasmic adaptor subunit n=1 Tax=Thiobacillus sp. TaxID=924 RepID=UPI0017953C93|nr:efflux RND transporter periplasmic adaptor subunit [Thiobacillus sp.]MBC2729291.1 efflux RND transporter periplasmic adaptor subunit [Thiobacillus sp.]MBC2738026.1 efflux RND transporter periplasmic adaptor subunit [Thiobacillus sp.]MBC2759619.1 efflux RND transporter periplasmic adaptor subunit [Thiobacillus sp.]
MENSHSQQRRGLKQLASLLLAGSLTATLLAGCGDKPAPEKDVPGKTEPANQGAQESPSEKPGEKSAGKLLDLSDAEIHQAGIKVQKLELQEKADQIVVTATIQANQDRLARVAPRVPGRIVKVNASLGNRVKAGQALAMLDSIDLGEARSAYLQAASEAAVAQAGFARAQRLNADSIIPEKDYLRARAEHEKAGAALRAAADRLRMMGVNPENLSGSVFPLTAPFAGTVIEKKAVLGELAPPDQSLFTVADLSTLWIEADLFEKDLAKVRPGMQASVTVSAYPGEVFKGRLTYISSVVDKDSRTVKARVEVPNLDGRLKPEMFATAAIQTGSGAKALLLPEDAVLLVQGQPTVFVAEKNGFAFSPRAVEVGERIQGRIVIRSGVAAGESVVTSGAYALKARLLKSQIGDAD